MRCPVIFTPQSQDDLRDIVSFIARESPDRATKFGNALIDKAPFHRIFPEMGQVVPEVGDSAVRQIIHGPYRIIYEVARNPDTIFIIRFWQAARGHPVPGEE
jgi:plasmid stabilization system protein ParE